MDGLTCVANLIAGTAAVYYTIVSSKPPDLDHPYGHSRLIYMGNVITVVAYAAVVGAVVRDLSAPVGYTVGTSAPLYALIGFVLYLVAILAVRGVSEALAFYAALTVSELIESGVTVASTLLATTVSYLVDYIGALVLLGFVVYEIIEGLRSLSTVVGDYAPPELVAEVRKLIEAEGVRVKAVRLRVMGRGRFCGDAVVTVPVNELRRAHDIVDRIERKVERLLGVKLVIHYEPSEP